MDGKAKKANQQRRGDGWQAEKSALTRRAILEAAVACLLERGYSQTTTAMIADQAGLSRGAMMHHFPSRFQVLRAVLEFLHEKCLDDYRALLAAIDSPGTGPGRALIDNYVAAEWRYTQLPGFRAYRELLSAGRTDPELAPEVLRAEKDGEKRTREILRETLPQWDQLAILEPAADLVQFTLRGMAFSAPCARKQQRENRVIDMLAAHLETLYLEAADGDA